MNNYKKELHDKLTNLATSYVRRKGLTPPDVVELLSFHLTSLLLSTPPQFRTEAKEAVARGRESAFRAYDKTMLKDFAIEGKEPN